MINEIAPQFISSAICFPLTLLDNPHHCRENLPMKLVQLVSFLVAAYFITIADKATAITLRAYKDQNSCSGASFNCNTASNVCCGPIPADYGYSVQYDNLPGDAQGLGFTWSNGEVNRRGYTWSNRVANPRGYIWSNTVANGPRGFTWSNRVPNGPRGFTWSNRVNPVLVNGPGTQCWTGSGTKVDAVAWFAPGDDSAESTDECAVPDSFSYEDADGVARDILVPDEPGAAEVIAGLYENGDWQALAAHDAV
ncbi:hypothetical protein CC2G_005049 [Coprinopsis cinerea AmutBmut pab1-1]|nr:hypothetical protein CC2G_005049 [Coprinopsis cinerea AmutBmut pab1-1]